MTEPKIHRNRFVKLLLTCAIIVLCFLLLEEGVAALALMPVRIRWFVIGIAMGLALVGAWIFTND